VPATTSAPSEVHGLFDLGAGKPAVAGAAANTRGMLADLLGGAKPSGHELPLLLSPNAAAGLCIRGLIAVCLEGALYEYMYSSQRLR